MSIYYIHEQCFSWSTIWEERWRKVARSGFVHLLVIVWNKPTQSDWCWVFMNGNSRQQRTKQWLCVRLVWSRTRSCDSLSNTHTQPVYFTPPTSGGSITMKKICIYLWSRIYILYNEITTFNVFFLSFYFIYLFYVRCSLRDLVEWCTLTKICQLSNFNF